MKKRFHRSYVTTFALLCLFELLSTGCKKRNISIAGNDICFRFTLNRNEVRATCNDYEKDKKREFSLTESILENAHAIKDPYAGVVALAPMFIVDTIIVMPIRCLGKTKGYVWPRYDKEKYKQRVYWGDNVVYVPSKYEKDGKVELIFEFVGNYDGEFSRTIVLHNDKRSGVASPPPSSPPPP